jgi:hypothetical protein
VHARQHVGNQIRSHLLQYFPAAIEAFTTGHLSLIGREARAVLQVTTTPATAATITVARLRALLRRSGRTRGIDDLAVRLHGTFRTDRLRQLPAVEDAMGHQLAGLLAQLDGVHRASPTWKTRSTKPSKPIPMQPFWPASQAWPPSPERGYWPRSATTATDSPTPGR